MIRGVGRLERTRSTFPGRRGTALLLAAALVVGVVLLGPPRTAHACSGLPVPPADESIRYVVSGWVRAISYDEQHPENALEAIPMTYTFEVDRIWRGTPPASFTFVDSGSAYGDTDAIGWGGMCGAMAEDPTDRYFLLAIPLVDSDFGLFHVYGAGSGPEDPNLDRGRDFLAEQFGVRPAAAGDAGLAATRAPTTGLATFAALVGLLLIGARRLTRPVGSPVDRGGHPR